MTLSAVRSAVQDPELSENAAHELLHFLMHEYAAHQLGGVAGTDEQQTQQRQLLEAQHAIIGKILGQSTARLGLEWETCLPFQACPRRPTRSPCRVFAPVRWLGRLRSRMRFYGRLFPAGIPRGLR